MVTIFSVCCQQRESGEAANELRLQAAIEENGQRLDIEEDPEEFSAALRAEQQEDPSLATRTDPCREVLAREGLQQALSRDSNVTFMTTLAEQQETSQLEALWQATERTDEFSAALRQQQLEDASTGRQEQRCPRQNVLDALQQALTPAEAELLGKQQAEEARTASLKKHWRPTQADVAETKFTYGASDIDARKGVPQRQEAREWTVRSQTVPVGASSERQEEAVQEAASLEEYWQQTDDGGEFAAAVCAQSDENPLTAPQAEQPQRALEALQQAVEPPEFQAFVQQQAEDAEVMEAWRQSEDAEEFSAALRLEQQAAALSVAAEAEARHLVKEQVEPFLKAHGYSDVNAAKRTWLGRTKYPLHSAVKENDPEILKLLLQAGADPMVKDSSGSTAAELAEQTGKGDSYRAVLAELQTC
eukprot:TRINITY_DN91592_c0_g1_i1.p1 TRINITY_DN91592_c0_g1~~TRINITY_DN91592_c0_g1_i1.p1  ORF type:complete len:418 (-),score=135.53 TRINITY_DN91592_c0_g1_i1:457-1710(-)